MGLRQSRCANAPPPASVALLTVSALSKTKCTVCKIRTGSPRHRSGLNHGSVSSPTKEVVWLVGPGRWMRGATIIALAWVLDPLREERGRSWPTHRRRPRRHVIEVPGRGKLHTNWTVRTRANCPLRTACCRS